VAQVTPPPASSSSSPDTTPLVALLAWGRLQQRLNVDVPAQLSKAQGLLAEAGRILG